MKNKINLDKIVLSSNKFTNINNIGIELLVYYIFIDLINENYMGVWEVCDPWTRPIGVRV